MTDPDPAASPIAQTLAGAGDAPNFAATGDLGPELGDGIGERPPFPPGCPVKPLGLVGDITGQQRCFYLDVRSQIVGLDAGNKHGKNSLIGLFGEKSAWLEAHFPQFSAPRYEGRGANRVMVKDCEIVGFDQADASRALIEQCARQGRFDPTGKLRGRGAHTSPSGGLVVHYGDKVLITRQRVDGTVKGFDYIDCGLVDGHVYPAADPSPRPWHEMTSARPAQKLLKLLQTWHWKRPLIDPRFLLGWIGAAMLGGALRWRPNIWITGGSGTGKSSLNGEDGVLDRLFGSGVLRTGSASAAAIRQILKNSTVPVLFDEIEASPDNHRVNDIIELARVSSSGATMHRGGADHQAHEFTLRSCFQFSSINIPPLQPQDRSRLGILELLPFPDDTPPLVLREWGLPEIARHLQRRMLDGWDRFELTIAKFQQALAARGHSRRACDQFGTLLAAADLLLNDHMVDDEELYEWAERCAPELIAEVSAATADHDACLAHLITTLVQAKGGDERETVGRWIARAVEAAMKIEEMAGDKSAERLQQRGLKVVNAKWSPPKLDEAGEPDAGRWGTECFLPSRPGFLAVAVSHRGLDEIFQHTTWQGGVWRQALARLPGCLESPAPVVRFGSVTARAVLVPLTAFMDDAELPPASRTEAAAEWLAIELGEAAPF